MEGGQVRRDQERRVAVLRGRCHPGRLARRIVWQLVPEEDLRAVLTAPDHLVLLVMLDSQAVRRDVVPGDDETGVAGILRPADRVAMVSPPGPDIVDDRVVG